MSTNLGNRISVTLSFSGIFYGCIFFSKLNLNQLHNVSLHPLKRTRMKFIGFLVFLVVFLMGFSMLVFLGLFVGYWLTLIGLESVNPKIAHAIIGHKEEESAE